MEVFVAIAKVTLLHDTRLSITRLIPRQQVKTFGPAG
jgi:hypothetical protein